MDKFLQFVALSLGLFWFSSGFVYAQETLYYVQIIGNGGRILQEKGPFGDYFDAQQWAVDWGVGNPKNLRLWKIVERKTEKPKTPFQQILAQGLQRYDDLMSKTKTIANAAGMQVPAAGDVLGEYKGSIENSYQSAKALRDKMSEFAEKAPQETLTKMDALVTETTQVESERLVMTEEAKFSKEVVNFTETQAKEKQQVVREVLDRISKTTDPAERQRLTEELKDLQKSGKLKEGLLADAKYQIHRDHYETTQKTLKEMEQSVAEHRTQMQEILQSMRIRSQRPEPEPEAPPEVSIVGSYRLWREDGSDPKIQGTYMIRVDGTGRYESENPRGPSFTFDLTWQQKDEVAEFIHIYEDGGRDKRRCVWDGERWDVFYTGGDKAWLERIP